MRNLLLSAAILITILSCKTENTYEDDAELCALLSEMFESDQRLRNSPAMKDPFFGILDSIKTANNLTDQEYAQLSNEEQLQWGKIARGIAETRPQVPKKVQDSLWKIQSEIDKKNTELLIDITKKKGWVTKTSLGCAEYIAPAIIFRHAPEEYWDEIKPLIEKEFTEKRMGSGDYAFIDNHLRGRPLDFYTGEEKDKKIRTID